MSVWWAFAGCGAEPQAAIPADASDGVVDASDTTTDQRQDSSSEELPSADTLADAGHLFDEAAAQPGVWTWVPVEGTFCRDGSRAGLGLRTHAAGEGLIIFMHGGGGCIDPVSCRTNRASFDEADFAEWVSELGGSHIFNPDNGTNPVRDWHAAFIAYCTGDLHGGVRTGVDVPGGPSDQRFVGHFNMLLMTALLRDYFRDVERVLLVGSSAGGFGTALNYVHVVEAFAPAPVTLLDDSGPFVPDDGAFAPCLQRRVRDLWGLDEVLPRDCASCFSPDGDGLSNLFAYLGTSYPDACFGLISSLGDPVIRTFYGYGLNDCDPPITRPIAAEDYRAGLFSLRASLPGNWGTYYSSGFLHAILALYPILSVDGVTLQSWISDLMAGQVSHVHPP